ncbi:hypothetical protein LABF186_07320 [Lactobacillus amylovorus subsp. animalium]|uniref:Transposase n=1 Tax=Lactobacillus amylovorus subsp. animalium TaxID=3378536 RepID=A0ABD0C2V6_LACAM|nr:hypothetical protein LABF186_07320 [Lactobacillus amylovorus]GMM16154.1 hypothetical protein LABF125_12880 [Lactobacillus amylovorus]
MSYWLIPIIKPIRKLTTDILVTVSVKLLHLFKVWKSLDGIIRLIDYDNKNDANQLIQRLERILYGK